MSQLWTGQELLVATAGRPLGRLPENVTGISIDSRSLKPGEAFFAIKGDRVDGHDFASSAMGAGAGLLVVAEAKLPALGRLAMPMIVVPDVLEAMVAVGIAARARSKAKIIAVTGSAGKTTTKELLRVALAPSGKVHASDRSFNNHWGVPLSLARMPADTDYAIFEIGMNHAGEIRPLVRMVRPHVAIVTLIAAAHLGHFKNLDEIADAKAEIFEGVEKDGNALINRDDERWKLLEKKASAVGIEYVWGFGEHSRAQFKLVDFAPGEGGSTFTARIAGKDHAVTLAAPGRHMARNALAALGAASLTGADVDKAAAMLASFAPDAGRGRKHRLRHPRGTFTLIDESYNANPASMRAAFELLAATPVGKNGRRIAVLGDMLELGDHSAKLHAGLAEPLAAAGVDKVLLGGPEMAVLDGKLRETMAVEYLPSVDELEPAVLSAVRPGDVLMIKSSNGIGFARIVQALLRQFPAAAGERRAAATKERGDHQHAHDAG
ncbi:MAG: UDP-N-acetylmuramoylalanyl-D-glutamyl-2,6-diaminopimelate--D-alanyl-D-alanine ligase [Rhizobiaceae bacterium]|nr:UDP-N-acetylmuramoylalanyl-D-glutamyl-2,6-diaminopimelate--D-alanyl-D-alanine ligase [Rhizobiaceae bacterium]